MLLFFTRFEQKVVDIPVLKVWKPQVNPYVTGNTAQNW